MRKLLYLPLLWFLWGCESDADSILIPYKAKMVLECYLNPSDPVIQATLQSSLPMVSSDSVLGIPDAIVQLSDGTKSITLPYQKGVYQINIRQFPLSAGTTYTLKASAPGYPAIEASCTIPPRATNTMVSWKDNGLSYVQRFRGYRVYRNYELQWKVAAPADPLYFGLGRRTQFVDTTTVDGRDSVTVGFNTYWDHFQTDREIAQNKPKMQVLIGRTSESDSTRLTTRYSELLLLQCDKNVFDFMRNVQIQQRNTYNPFAEATLIPSNVKNGLGVFGAIYLRRTSVQ